MLSSGSSMLSNVLASSSCAMIFADKILNISAKLELEAATRCKAIVRSCLTVCAAPYKTFALLLYEAWAVCTCVKAWIDIVPVPGWLAQANSTNQAACKQVSCPGLHG